MIKKYVAACVCFSLLFAGCSVRPGGEDSGQTVDGDTEAIIPKYNISDDYYRVVQPFKPSPARGLAVANINNRLDMNEFETGLMRLSQKYYSTDDYYYQEGQHLTKEMLNDWMRRKYSENQQKDREKRAEKTLPNDGLNPVDDEVGSLEERNENNPIYVSHILEQNYLVKNKKGNLELGGVTIGIALNSVHYFNQEQGYPRETKISEEEIAKEGKRIAQEVATRLRQIPELKNVPITIGLFQLEGKSSLVPGHFFNVTQLEKGETTIDSWDKVKEDYILFPSSEAKAKYRENATKFEHFRNDISKYFPNHTGVIGEGYYVNDQITRLNIRIPIQFYGKSEVIGFTQYVAGLVVEHFPNYMEVNVEITSSNGEESLIVRKQDKDDPVIYMY
ncbi:MAG: CamS family sex pheromone protein [Bacilli bacterium]